METKLQEIKQDMEALVAAWNELDYLQPGDIFVIGCSTSEVAGEHIGTAGSEEIAEVIFTSLQKLVAEKGISLAFQCCEHLNRALVIERSVQERVGQDEVAVIPVREAGGSMASYAYKHFTDAVVVEEITANAGIDIGDTLIGMHLKHVAVPVRFQQKTVGSAHVTIARTRPKLIGGKRAYYGD